MNNLFIDQAILTTAQDMQKKALCLYSQFPVGAAVQTDDHQIVGGFNIESASYGLTICAERVAIFSALAQGHKNFTHIALVTNTGSFPCGACRQILYEFCPKAHITIATKDKIINTIAVVDLMPYAFGSTDIEK